LPGLAGGLTEHNRDRHDRKKQPELHEKTDVEPTGNVEPRRSWTPRAETGASVESSPAWPRALNLRNRIVSDPGRHSPGAV
jgi:hypothetical protein